MTEETMERVALWLTLAALTLGSVWAAETPAGKSSLNDRLLKAYLEKHPEADADGDGVLTAFEHEQYLPQDILKKLAKGTRHEHHMVAMRDGVKLATEVFLPPGEGRRATVLMRPAYGRWTVGGYAARYREEGFVFVVQDLRGKGDSEGSRDGRFPDRYGFGVGSFQIDIDDGADALAWVAKQPWSNGRIAMTGGSGRGMAAIMAMWSASPHLTMCAPGNTGGCGMLYWLYHDGVAKWSLNWLHHRGARVPEWPKPHTRPFDVAEWRAFTAGRAAKFQGIYTDDTGWYDPMGASALDNFALLQDTGRAFIRVNPRGHGGVSGLEYPRAMWPRGVVFPGIADVLRGKTPPAGTKSTMVYYLMGDVRRKGAPGNEYRVTHVWPVPHEPTSLYLAPGGTLRRETVKDEALAGTWHHDPRKPTPTLGGHYNWRGDLSGPHDQRPLRKRADVLYFVSEPLAEPLTITGEVRAELFVDTDVPDTTYVVKLVDIYPDGYEAIVREGAAMLRYRGGWGEAAPPAEKGTVYKVPASLGSTALVFDAGHRVAALVTSSSDPAYEVHPNTYEPAPSFEESPVATNRLHAGGERASKLILPVVPLEYGKE
jgi:predicted acyl esterase